MTWCVWGFPHPWGNRPWGQYSASQYIGIGQCIICFVFSLSPSPTPLFLTFMLEVKRKWWITPLILVPRRPGRQISWCWGQSALHIQFQVSPSYIYGPKEGFLTHCEIEQELSSFKDRVPLSSGGHWTYYVAEADFKLLSLLFLPSECWD